MANTQTKRENGKRRHFKEWLRSSSFLWTGGTFLVGCACAAATEWIQSWLPWRSADPVDFQADLLALAACSVFILVIILLKHKK